MFVYYNTHQIYFVLFPEKPQLKVGSDSCFAGLECEFARPAILACSTVLSIIVEVESNPYFCKHWKSRFRFLSFVLIMLTGPSVIRTFCNSQLLSIEVVPLWSCSLFVYLAIVIVLYSLFLSFALFAMLLFLSGTRNEPEMSPFLMIDKVVN